MGDSRNEHSILTADQARIAAAASVAQALGEIAWQIQVDQADLIASLIHRDEARLRALGEKYAEIGSVAAEVLEVVWEHAGQIANTDFKKGRLAGRIVGEAGVIVTTAGVGVALKSATAASLISRVRQIDVIADNAVLVQKLDGLGNRLTNAGAAAQAAGSGRAGDAIFTTLWRKTHGGESTWKDAFLEFLDETNDPFLRAQYDPELGAISEEVFKRMAAEATGPGGAVDLAKYPTYNELNTKLMGRRTFPGQTHLNTNAHHLVRKDLVNAFFQNTTDAQRNKMPAVLLPVEEHKLYEKLLRDTLRAMGEPPYNQEDVLDALRDAYNAFGRPELYPIARQWLMGPTP